MRPRTLGRRAGAAVALAVALVLALPAAPASAAPVVTITQPAANAVLDSSSVTVTGRAEVDPALSSTLSALESVTVTVNGESVRMASCEGKRACDFSATFTLRSNGTYKATATAEQSGILGATTNTATRDFSVAAPPKAPVLDKPKVNEDRSVQLSWTKNAEPDILFYVVSRKDAGSSSFVQASGKIPQPPSGAKVTFTDTAPSASVGGDVAYQVYAVRKGVGSDIASAPSAVATVTVPPPPTTTTAPQQPGVPVVPSGPTTTAKPGPPGGVDLSGYLTPRSQPRAVPPLTIPEPPDTGFSGKLPFGSLPAGEELEEGEEEAVPPPNRFTSVITRIQSGRPLVPVAGGLVLVLLALHMRLLNRRIKEMPEGDLPVDPAAPTPGPPPVAATGPAPAPAPEPEPDPEPVVAGAAPAAAPARTALYDVDDDWAPIPADLDLDLEPEPEPEPVVAAQPAPVLEPEPEPEPVVEPELEPVDLWALPPLDEPLDEPLDAQVDPDEIEVFEVVSPTRRRLARAGSR